MKSSPAVRTASGFAAKSIDRLRVLDLETLTLSGLAKPENVICRCHQVALSSASTIGLGLRGLEFIRYDEAMQKKNAHILTVVMFALAALAMPASAVDGEALPKRKPGLWQLTTITEATGMTTNKVCIGANDSIAAPGGGRSCGQPKVERAGDQVMVNLTCTSPLGEERISTLFTGDFQRWYRGTTKMTFDPGSSNGPRNIGVTVLGQFVSPDCQD